jgi:hypothetical protein
VRFYARIYFIASTFACLLAWEAMAAVTAGANKSATALKNQLVQLRSIQRVNAVVWIHAVGKLENDRAKLTGPLTMISVPSQQCYQNFPFDPYESTSGYSAAELAAAQWRLFSPSVSCASLGMPVFVGYLASTGRSVAVFAPNASVATTLCQSQTIEGCGLTANAGTAGVTSTVLARDTAQCYEGYTADAAQKLAQSNPRLQVFSSAVSCPIVGMPVFVGYLPGSGRAVSIYSSSAASGQAICESGLVDECVFVSTTQSAGYTLISEFFNERLNRYFRTSDRNESDFLRATPASEEKPTGDNFLAYSSPAEGTVPVCRFYGSVSPGPNSHFLTADVNECIRLRQIQAETSSTQKRWNFEGIAFHIAPPVSDQCPKFAPNRVFRAYNRGIESGRDSNHRLTSNVTTYNAMLEQGWFGEGVVMCAP